MTWFAAGQCPGLKSTALPRGYCTPCDRSSTSSLVGQRVAAILRRSSTSSFRLVVTRCSTPGCPRTRSSPEGTPYGEICDTDRRQHEEGGMVGATGFEPATT